MRITNLPRIVVLLLAALVLQAVAAESSTAAPAQAPAAYASAAALQKQGLFELAIDEWQSLLKDHADDPRAPRARYNLGVCLFSAGQFDVAAEQFAQVADAEKFPKIAEGALANLGLSQLNSARAMLSTDEPDAEAIKTKITAATESLAKVIEQFPAGEQSANAQFYRGEAFSLLGEHGEAAAAFQSVLENTKAESLHRQTRLGLASALIETKQVAKIDEIVTPLIGDASAPQLAAEAQLLRAEARLQADRPAEAAADFAAASIVPNFSDAEYARERAAFCHYLSNDYAAAASAYDSLVKDFPASALAAAGKVSSAKCWLLADRADAAAARFAALWNADPSAANADAAHWLAQSLLKQNQPAEAVKIAKQALATEPADELAAQLELDAADALVALPNQLAAAADAYEKIASTRFDTPIGTTARFYAARTAMQVGDAERATKLAEQFLRENDDPQRVSDARLILAEAQLLQKNYDAAVNGFDALIAPLSADSLPDKRLAAWEKRLARALYERGRSLSEASKLDAANADFVRIIQTSKDPQLTPYARLAYAANQYAGQQWQAAADTLAMLLKQAGEGPKGEARFLLASTLQQQGKLEESLALLAKPDELVAPPADQLRLKGLCLAGLKRTPEAIATHEEFLKAHAEHPAADRVWYDLAWLQRDAKQDERALAAFDQLVRDHADSPLAAEAALRAGEIQNGEKRFDQAAQRFATAAELAATQPALREQALHLQGWAEFSQSHQPRAAEVFAQQLKEFPQGSLATDAQLMRGESLFAVKQFTDALKSYETGLAGKTPRAELELQALLHAGQAAGQIGEWQKSLALLDRAAKHGDAESQETQIAYERAWALQNLGRRDEAAPLFAEIADVEIGPLAARARFMQGELQFADKKYEQAVRTFFKVAYGYGGEKAPATYHSWQAESLFEAARCLEQINAADSTRQLDGKAAALYQELVRRFPDAPKSQLAKQRLQQLGVGQAGQAVTTAK